MTDMEEMIRRHTEARMKQLDEAILLVGLQGGGKVVEEHPNFDPLVIKFTLVFNDQPEPRLPPNRVEYHVPAIYRG